MVYWCTGSTCWMLEGTRFHVFLFFWVHLRQILFQFDSVTFGSCRLAGGCSAKMPSSCDPINYLVATLIFASNIWILLKLLSSFMNHDFQHIQIFGRGFPELGKNHGLPHSRNGLTVEPRPVSCDEHVSQAGEWDLFVSTFFFLVTNPYHPWKMVYLPTFGRSLCKCR